MLKRLNANLFLIFVLTVFLAACGEAEQEKDYRIVLNGNGGSPITQVVYVKYGDPMPPAQEPSRYNYLFVGYLDSRYWTDQTGSDFYYLPGYSGLVSNKNWDMRSDATLYAIWY
jgi:hypothetical protein